MNDDQYLLASAYADGHVTADERARAEADADVMAEVARIRELGADLREVTPADPAVRAAMIAAAMQEFAKPLPVSVTPVRARPAFAWARPLGLAAAAVAALAVGAVVVNQAGGGGSDDDASSPAATAFEITAGDAGRSVDPAATDVLDEEASTLSDLEQPAGATPEAPAEFSVATEATDAAVAAGTEAPATTVAGGTLPAAGEAPLIETPDDLAALGLALRDAYDSGAAPPAAPDTACTFNAAVDNPAPGAEATAAEVRDTLPANVEQIALLDTANYLLADGTPLAVFVAVDLESAQTYAIDAAECALVAVASAP